MFVHSLFLLLIVGQDTFKSNCGFCHGDDASGGRAPDLIRSALVLHDENGNLVAPVIKNGRPDKGMPAFPSLKEDQIKDIVSFLHNQANEALHSGHIPGDYPLSKLLTGSAEAGKAYFDGPGGCKSCHPSVKDLAGIASRYKPIDLQQKLVYPGGGVRTAVVITPDKQRFEGKIKNLDEFNIGIICDDGWYRSFERDKVTVEITDTMAAHRELTTKMTDTDMHNLFAYLETMK